MSLIVNLAVYLDSMEDNKRSQNLNIQPTLFDLAEHSELSKASHFTELEVLDFLDSTGAPNSIDYLDEDELLKVEKFVKFKQAVRLIEDYGGQIKKHFNQKKFYFYTTGPNGEKGRAQVRNNIPEDQRFFWEKSTDPIFPFLIDILPRQVEKVFLVEGLTDALTLKQSKFHSVGFPGVQNVNAEYFGNITTAREIVIVQEADNAGVAFVKKINEALDLLNYQGSRKVLPIFEICKDTNEFYLRWEEEGGDFAMVFTEYVEAESIEISEALRRAEASVASVPIRNKDEAQPSLPTQTVVEPQAPRYPFKLSYERDEFLAYEDHVVQVVMRGPKDDPEFEEIMITNFNVKRVQQIVTRKNSLGASEISAEIEVNCEGKKTNIVVNMSDIADARKFKKILYENMGLDIYVAHRRAIDIILQALAKTECSEREVYSTGGLQDGNYVLGNTVISKEEISYLDQPVTAASFIKETENIGFSQASINVAVRNAYEFISCITKAYSNLTAALLLANICLAVLMNIKIPFLKRIRIMFNFIAHLNQGKTEATLACLSFFFKNPTEANMINPTDSVPSLNLIQSKFQGGMFAFNDYIGVQAEGDQATYAKRLQRIVDWAPVRKVSKDYDKIVSSIPFEGPLTHNGQVDVAEGTPSLQSRSITHELSRNLTAKYSEDEKLAAFQVMQGGYEKWNSVMPHFIQMLLNKDNFNDEEALYKKFINEITNQLSDVKIQPIDRTVKNAAACVVSVSMFLRFLRESNEFNEVEIRELDEIESEFVLNLRSSCVNQHRLSMNADILGVFEEVLVSGLSSGEIYVKIPGEKIPSHKTSTAYCVGEFKQRDKEHIFLYPSLVIKFLSSRPGFGEITKLSANMLTRRFKDQDCLYNPSAKNPRTRIKQNGELGWFLKLEKFEGLGKFVSTNEHYSQSFRSFEDRLKFSPPIAIVNPDNEDDIRELE